MISSAERPTHRRNSGGGIEFVLALPANILTPITRETGFKAAWTDHKFNLLHTSYFPADGMCKQIPCKNGDGRSWGRSRPCLAEEEIVRRLLAGFLSCFGGPSPAGRRASRAVQVGEILGATRGVVRRGRV